jgi:2-polyprenyl-3-methyl-5-hydroxy-6-metoxy-1,4-benzoquinol methylase
MREASGLHCRSCGAGLDHVFVDLGQSPISNALRRPEQAGEAEAFYPLRTFVCDVCRLVQLQEVASREAHFHDDYAYFSSYSDSWLRHAQAYAEAMIPRLGLGPQSRVVEVASNDGYLLQYFKARGVPVQGVDPAANCARVAQAERGVPTLVRFFGVETAADMVADGLAADLIASNNVMAHVPDLNDFVGGMKILLKPDGVWTVEFPHLLALIEQAYFDTIYHEHYSYLSLLAVERLLERHGLRAFDLEHLPTHGGSLRVFIGHAGRTPDASAALREFRQREAAAGLDGDSAYDAFAERVKATKRDLLKLLIGLKEQGLSIVAYGAPAKGVTLLNYCGIGRDFLDYAVDRSPQKQGRLLPGVALPVHAPERIFETRPDRVLILPWNLKDEIIGKMSGIRDWGGRFVLPLPEPMVLP